MKRYQGEDIGVTLRFKADSAGSAMSWNDYQEVYVYFYTSVNHIAQFGRNISAGTTPAGCQPITISNDGKNLAFDLQSADTLLMCGSLKMDILIYKSGTNKDMIKSVLTGIEIMQTPIKERAHL